MNGKLSVFLSLLMFFVLLAAPLAARAEGKRKCAKCEPSVQRDRKVDWESLHEKRIARLTEKLSLTAEQSENISRILKDGWDKIRAEKEAMRKRVKELRELTDKKIEELLSEEQKTKFREHLEKRKDRMRMRKKCL